MPLIILVFFLWLLGSGVLDDVIRFSLAIVVVAAVVLGIRAIYRSMAERKRFGRNKERKYIVCPQCLNQFSVQTHTWSYLFLEGIRRCPRCNCELYLRWDEQHHLFNISPYKAVQQRVDVQVRQHVNVQARQHVDVDRLTGLEFERHVENYLRCRGYRTELTKASGDFGVDIIAFKDDKKYAVQVKRYKGAVSRSAVSDAVAGKIYYRCDAAMVITNSTFTKSAKEMAQATGCLLYENVT